MCSILGISLNMKGAQLVQVALAPVLNTEGSTSTSSSTNTSTSTSTTDTNTGEDQPLPPSPPITRPL